jgi:hypothetical protein
LSEALATRAVSSLPDERAFTPVFDGLWEGPRSPESK